MTEDNPYWYWKAKHPNYWRRAEWHDYSSRCIYMITLLKAADQPAFGTIVAPDNNPDKATCRLSQLGAIVYNEIQKLGKVSKAVDVPSFVIMPDHVHMVIFVKEAGVTTLGNIVRYLKGSCTSAWARAKGNQSKPSVFLKGYHDRILRGKGQYARLKKYVKDNPRRLYIKTHCPQYFSEIREIEINGNKYKIRGNHFLLDSPSKMAVKISRRYSEEEKERYKSGWIDNASRGGILVSPFIHPEEKEILKRCVEVGGAVIHIVEKGFAPRSKPYGIFFDLCAQG